MKTLYLCSNDILEKFKKLSLSRKNWFKISVQFLASKMSEQAYYSRTSRENFVLLQYNFVLNFFLRRLAKKKHLEFQKIF